MIAQNLSIPGLLSLLLVALTLTGCSSNPEPDDSAATAFQLPPQLEELRLSDNGVIRAYIQIDGGTRQEMTVTGSSASIDLSATEGSHDITVIIEFVPTGGSAVTLAEATKTLAVSASGSNSLSFVATDFDFSAHDDDGDTYSNLSEMQAGSSAPVMESTTPVDSSTDVVATTAIDITFDDPMKLSTLQTAFTVSGASVGSIAGAVTFDDATYTATFTPSQDLRAYETYTATVSTTAENTADVTLASAVSWSFTIQEPPVQQVSTVQTSGATTTPTLEFNSSGNGIAVWEVSNIGRSLVTSYFDGTSWATEEILVSITNNTPMSPQLISNGTGFALVWLQYEGTTYELYGSFHDGSGWSTPQALETETASASSPQLASNGTGYAVTWYQQETGSGLTRIYTRISSDASSWDAVTAIDNNSANARTPRIVSNGSEYAVIWQQGSPYGIWVRIYDGTWSSVSQLDTPSATYSAYNHQIASNGSNYSVIWYRYDGTRYNIYSRTYDATGSSWSSQADIDGSSNTSIISSQDNLTSNDTGYAVTFLRYDGSSGYDAYAVINANGDATWGTPASLESGSGTVYSAPIITSNGSSYAALWPQYDGSSTYDLIASVYTGSSWPGGSAIEAGSSAIYSGFKLESIGTKYIAAWRQQASGTNEIFINIYDSSWSPSVTQLSSASGSVGYPEMEYNPGGEVAVAWSETGSGIYVSSYDDISWSAQTALNTTAFGGSSYTPRLFHNGNGQTLAIWRQYSGNNYNLYANIHQSGSWGTPVVLSSGNVSSSYMYAVSDGAGFAVAWSESDGAYNSIYANIYDGSAWSGTEEVDNGSIDGDAFLYDTYGTRTVISSNGSGYMLVFRQYDGSSYYDTYAVAHDGTSWGSPVALDLATNNYNTGNPVIQTLGSSGYLAMWYQSDGTATRMYTSEFDGTDWQTAQTLESSGNPFYAYPTNLISNGTGLLTVWSQFSGTQYRAYTATYTAGGSWSTPIALDTGTVSHHVYSSPVAVHSSSGEYAVVWTEYNGSTYELMATNYDGSSWSTATSLDDGSAGSIAFAGYYYPVLASNGSDFAVTWSRSNGSAYDAYASVFDGTSWSAATSLESDAATAYPVHLVSDGDSFLAGWLQDDGSSVIDFSVNYYDPSSGWDGKWVIDEDASNNAADFFLGGSADGYLGAWTQADPAGDPAVRFPWSKILF